MIDAEILEQRLRRTFQVVAAQPVEPLGDPEPWSNGARGPRPRRQVRVMAGGLAVLVVIALVALGVVHGPRSARVSPTTPGASAPVGLGGATIGTRAVFAPSTPTSAAMLEEAAATMVIRLHALGDTDATATVVHGSIVITSSPFTGAQMQLIGSMGSFMARPVACGAPAETATVSPTAPGPTPPASSSPDCDAQYATTAANLDVNPTTGQPRNRIGPDPVFGSYPSTPARDDYPAGSVLLPADPVAGAQQYPRFALEAAQLGNADIAHVQARLNQPTDSWLIDVTLTASGATAWNDVALANFHAYVAFDLDGEVLSAPLIEPTTSTFFSFGTQMQISGDFSATNARTIAAVLESGPLPVAFTLQSLSTVS